MRYTRFSGRMALLFMIVVTTFLPVTLFAQSTTPPPGLSGVIASIQGKVITLTLADSTQKTVVLQDTTLVLIRQASAVDQIKSGDALGVTAHRDNGVLVATNINIFAPQMYSGVKKGQFPMNDVDLMTNAVVESFAQGMNGHTLTMTLAEGTSQITVPDGIPVHRLVLTSQSQLTVGLQVSIRVSTDAAGKMMATSISFDQPAKS